MLIGCFTLSIMILDEKDLAKRFGIDEHEALQFLEVDGDNLREFMCEL